MFCLPTKKMGLDFTGMEHNRKEITSKLTVQVQVDYVSIMGKSIDMFYVLFFC